MVSFIFKKSLPIGLEKGMQARKLKLGLQGPHTWLGCILTALALAVEPP